MTKQYPCPCCGYLTLAQKPPGSYLICPICFWEDARTLGEWGTNKVDLREAQQNFLAFGACEKDWIYDTHPPTDNDLRLANWRTLDETFEPTRLSLLQVIETAFENVTRDDGMTLLEAAIRDDCIATAEEIRAERKIRNWQDVPDDLIRPLYFVLNFLDPIGFRFYISAYMTWSLKHYNNSDSNSDAYTVYAFSGLDYEHKVEQFKVMSRRQAKAICQFLRFAALYDLGGARDSAIEALSEYWSQFCPEEPGQTYYKNGCI